MKFLLDRDTLQWFQEELLIKHDESIWFTVIYGRQN